MSILNAIKQQTESIDDLAKLPQVMIMQMTQKGQIREDMLAPILSRKAEMVDAVARMQALQNAGQTLPTVMEQVMANNAMAEQPQVENMGVSQLPIPERQYAGGGIIAFSRGSLVDLDDDEIDPYDDYAKATAAIQRANAMPVAGPSIFSQSYESALANESQPSTFVPKTMAVNDIPLDIPKRGSHKYEDMVIKEAQRIGLDPSIAVHALYKETGNLKNPETAKSSAGAIGVMQLMPKTAKSLGVDPLIPEENIRGGVTYLKQMYDKYQDPTLALAAYNAGPGRLDKALKSGQGISGLPRETQNYIVASRMASGGEVKHFQYGGSTMDGFELDSYPSNDSLMSPEYQKYFEEYQAELQKRMKSKKDIPPSLQAPSLKAEPIETKKTPDAAPAVDNKLSTVDNKLPPVIQEKAPEQTPEESQFAAFFKKLDQSEANLAKQRSEDKNMALLAAGLGMMGGTSPYAFANIGQGGLSGISYLSGTNRERAAQQAALDKNRVAAMHYGNVGKYYAGQTLSKDERAELQRQKLEADKIKSARDDFYQFQKMVDEGFAKQYPMAAITPDDPKTIRLKQEWIAKNSPVLESLRKSAYPNLPSIVSSAPVSTQGFKLVK
jgi:hypothetical protein